MILEQYPHAERVGRITDVTEDAATLEFLECGAEMPLAPFELRNATFRQREKLQDGVTDAFIVLPRGPGAFFTLWIL
jgi:hypothetical protein